MDPISILYEDRSVIAIDKPAGWLLVPVSWQKTNRNLQAALLSSIAAGDFWARSRNIKFLRNIHRLDGDTSGILLLAKSPGALDTLGDLFETRRVEKIYAAVTNRRPKEPRWTCQLSLAPDPKQYGRMMADGAGKPAETEFRVVGESSGLFLIEARPYTGRTHQIRVHLARSGCPIVGDDVYGAPGPKPLGLRAAGLAYQDPFTKRPVPVRAPMERFLVDHGFRPDDFPMEFRSVPSRANRPASTPFRPDRSAPTP